MVLNCLINIKYTKCFFCRKIPSDLNKERVELAIKSLNEFTRRPDTLPHEDVLTMDAFAMFNNLSLTDILRYTEMVLKNRLFCLLCIIKMN